MMGKLAPIATPITIASILAAALGGCGYSELKAPCGPDEGQVSAASYLPFPTTSVTRTLLDQFAAVPIPIADPCGPLRPINRNLAMAANRSAADDPP
jgi:hypothetical protein